MTFFADPLSRRWWRNWGIRVLLTVFGCFGLAAAHFVYQRHRAVNELAAAVAELDQTDPGWRLDDIEAARAVLPDAENSATVVSQAAAAMPRGWPPGPLQERLADVAPQVRLDEEDAEYLRKELAIVDNALQLARKVADLPRGRHPITYQRNLLATLLPHADQTRKLHALLQLDAVAQAQDGNLTGALRSCRALLNASRSMGDEPLMISQLVRMAGVAVAVRDVERVLAQGEVHAEELRKLQSQFEEEERFPRLLICIRGERALWHELYDALECGDVTLSEIAGSRDTWWESMTGFTDRQFVREQHPILLGLFTEATRIAALPAHERAEPMSELTSKAVNSGPLIRLLWPAMTKIDDSARRTDGYLRCLIAALAAERYRRANGHFPDSLEHLVPDFLPMVPLDPQDGQALRYQRLADRVVVYSLAKGTGLSNNLGGYDPDEPSPPGIGVAVHLFEVKHRRQPALEVVPPPTIDNDEPQ